MTGIYRILRIIGVSQLIRLKKAKNCGEGVIRGYFLTRTLSTLFNIGFFEEFRNVEKINVVNFCEKRKLDKVILKALCDYLYSLNILEKEKDSYSLGKNGNIFVDVLRGFFDIAYAYEDVFHFLEPMVRMEEKFGKGVRRREEFVAKGSGQAATLLPFPIVKDIIKKNNYQTILDLGCGDGTFLIDLCESNNHIRAYGLDISRDAVYYGLKKLNERQLGNRINLFEGDMFQLNPIHEKLKKVDVATSFFALHEFISPDTDKVEEFLIKFKRVFPNTPLIICELMRETPERLRKNPSFALEHYLFHDLSNQRQIAREEWRQILNKSGFAHVQEIYVEFAKVGIFISC